MHCSPTDYDQAELCFNHVIRIRKSLRQDEFNHPDVLNASKMETRIAYMKKKMERAKRKKAKRDARRRRKLENDARMLPFQAEQNAAKLREAEAVGNSGTASSRRMQKRKEKRRSSTGALNNAMIEEAVEKLSAKDSSTDSAGKSHAERESASISQRLRTSFQRFDPEDTAGRAGQARSGLQKESSLQNFEFSKFMDAVKNIKGSLGDELQEVQRQNAKSLQPVVEETHLQRSEEEQLSDNGDDMSAESYDSEGTPEDFDEEEFTKSLVASNDEEEDEDDEVNEDAYGDAFDELTAPFLVVGATPRSGDSIVSAMNESTASDWREEQSLVAKFRHSAGDTPAGDDRADDDDDDDLGGSAGGLSLEEWQKFKKAAQNIYSNANVDAMGEDGGVTKPRDLDFERESVM